MRGKDGKFIVTGNKLQPKFSLGTISPNAKATSGSSIQIGLLCFIMLLLLLLLQQPAC